tara:strand:- start:65 stop:751 length:687 start_codon:yes stop_codon:yes gene_type:complete
MEINGITLTDKQRKGFSIINQNTTAQRNNYYGAVLAWEENNIRRGLKDAKDPVGRTSSHYIKHFENQLEKLSIMKLTWLQDAEKYFNEKLLVMVSKLDKFGLLESNIMLDVRNMEVSEGAGLEFWIRGWDTEVKDYTGRVHARLVPVDGYEKCFHYRFICTLKDAPKKTETKEVEVKEECSITAPILKGSRTEQVANLLELDYSAKKIAETLGSNVSYIQSIVRKLKK